LLSQLRDSNKTVLDMVSAAIDADAVERDGLGELVVVDLADMLNQIISARKTHCESKQIKIAAALKEKTDFVNVDVYLMYRALENLLDHLIKRAENGDTIDLQLASEGDDVVLRVVAAERPLTLIERETLLNASADDGPRYKPGAIVSLHISKIIIEAHDGTLSFEVLPTETEEISPAAEPAAEENGLTLKVTLPKP
jgi:K+-sensing histidine kinase KdpD